MTADDLLNILEQRELVSAGVLSALRKQVATANRPIAPSSVIKLLVDKQELTPRQAEQLLRTAAPAAVAVKPVAAQAVKPVAKPASSLSLEEELGLAPSKPVAPAAVAVKPVAAQAVKPVAKPASSLSLEEELGLAPSKSVAPAAVTVKPVAAQAVKPVAKPASSLSLEEELGLAPSMSVAPAAVTVKPVAAQAVKPVAKPASSLSLEEELGLAPSKSVAPAPVTVKPVAAQAVKPVAKPASSTSLEDEMGLTTESAGPASQAPTKPAATKPTAAKADTGQIKPAAAHSSAAADLGLDDLFSESESGAGLFDAGLLGAAADETPAGPLDAPADGRLSAAVATAASALPVAAVAPRAVRPKRWKKVLRIVAGALGVMLLAAGIAAAVLSRGTGEPQFLAAETDYHAQAWAAAVTKYNELLHDYPSQAHAGAARVHRGLAQLRAELGERPEWQRVLETAEHVLPEIASEPEFAELHAELALILTDMADALVRSAAETDDPAEVERRVAQGRRALALATDSRYVPPPDRPWERLQDIDDRLAVLARDVERPKALATAALEIQQATARPDPAAGFAAREKLVERFPELAANDVLQDKLAALTAAEQGLAKLGGDKPRPAAHEERATPIKGWTSITNRRSPATAGAPGPPALVALEGALYAFDSAGGKVLWRRFVGAGPAASAVLLPAARPAGGADALLVDERYPDLLRVDAVSGRIQWRQTFDKPLTGPPAVAGAAAYLTTRAAMVHRVDLKTGELTQSISLPSPPVGSPVPSGDGRHVFQLSARGELFTLAADDLACAGALYLGAESGGLTFPPQVAGRYLVVVDNHGLDESSLRVVALDAQGLPAEVASVVPIAGRIAALPVVVGNHLIVVTEYGSVTALEITTNRDSPLKKTSEAGGGLPTARWFVVASGAQVWVVGAGWRGFELQKGRLMPRGKSKAADVFAAAPTAVGGSIVGLVRRPGERGAVVFASSWPGSRLWEVEIGDVPDQIADDGSADWPASMHLATVDQAGRETKIDLTQQSGWKTLENFATGMRMANQRWLWWRGSAAGGSVLFDPKRGPERVLLPAESVAMPAALAGGLLVPVADGALMLVDPSTGRSLATPFRPNVFGGESVRWTAPALTPKGAEAVIADDHPTLYLVALQKDPQAQLHKLAGAELESPVVAGPIVAGTVVYLVTGDGLLRAYELPGLKPAGEWKLPSRFVTWMRPAGDLALVASGGELVGCSAAKKLLWKSPLDGGAPCGPALATQQDIAVATSAGRVARFDAGSGKELAKVELGQPLAGGLTLLRDGVCTAKTADGCRLEFAIP